MSDSNPEWARQFEAMQVASAQMQRAHATPDAGPLDGASMALLAAMSPTLAGSVRTPRDLALSLSKVLTSAEVGASHLPAVMIEGSATAGVTRDGSTVKISRPNVGMLHGTSVGSALTTDALGAGLPTGAMANVGLDPAAGVVGNAMLADPATNGSPAATPAALASSAVAHRALAAQNAAHARRLDPNGEMGMPTSGIPGIEAAGARARARGHDAAAKEVEALSHAPQPMRHGRGDIGMEGV